jgi:hypothetical protein
VELAKPLHGLLEGQVGGEDLTDSLLARAQRQQTGPRAAVAGLRPVRADHPGRPGGPWRHEAIGQLGRNRLGHVPGKHAGALGAVHAAVDANTPPSLREQMNHGTESNEIIAPGEPEAGPTASSL